jgi:hypothetical protein
MIPGIKLPVLDYNKLQRNIRTGRGGITGEESLSGFYSLEQRNPYGRDKIEVNNAAAVGAIVSPLVNQRGISVSMSLPGMGQAS